MLLRSFIVKQRNNTNVGLTARRILVERDRQRLTVIVSITLRGPETEITALPVSTPNSIQVLRLRSR